MVRPRTAGGVRKVEISTPDFKQGRSLARESTHLPPVYRPGVLHVECQLEQRQMEPVVTWSLCQAPPAKRSQVTHHKAVVDPSAIGDAPPFSQFLIKPSSE